MRFFVFSFFLAFVFLQAPAAVTKDTVIYPSGLNFADESLIPEKVGILEKLQNTKATDIFSQSTADSTKETLKKSSIESVSSFFAFWTKDHPVTEVKTAWLSDKLFRIAEVLLPEAQADKLVDPRGTRISEDSTSGTQKPAASALQPAAPVATVAPAPTATAEEFAAEVERKRLENIELLRALTPYENCMQKNSRSLTEADEFCYLRDDFSKKYGRKM